MSANLFRDAPAGDAATNVRIANFHNSYAALPASFFARRAPTQVRQPRLIRFNQALANELRLDVETIEAQDPAQIFAGNRTPAGAEPIAMAYAGHQFGHFVPQLGDGRAILMGEVIDAHGVRRDIQWKGAGPTPFSRSGDGRAALGPVLREYVVSEAMHALGIPTTRALAAVTSGEIVSRGEPLPGAVLTRVAASHVRVGTFQYFAARGDEAAVRRLADYVIERHYPAARESERPYLALLESVVERQASLIARWMQVGFIHGVMNTDNMAVSGETIDFGPCAFMDAYDSSTVFSSIDHLGRYAYGNQPRVAAWNLARLAETLLDLIDANPDRAVTLATECIAGFAARYDARWLSGMRGKIGLAAERDGDRERIERLLALMQASAVDFTLGFRRLADAAAGSQHEAEAPLRSLFANPTAYDDWAEDWRRRLAEEPQPPQARRNAMRRVNPAIIPRNHRVEAMIQAATANQDLSPFHAMVEALSSPFAQCPDDLGLSEPPLEHQRVLQTFCGT